MKLTLQSAVFGLFALQQAMAAPMASCGDQSACINFTIDPVAENDCSSQGCTFKVCMTLSQASSRCPSSISHVCTKPEGMCDGGTGFELAAEVTGVSLAHSECQIVGPNSVVEFLVKDGGGCSGSATVQSGYGVDATCAPRTEATPSCTGNGVGKECIWTMTTPSCSVDEPADEPADEPVETPKEEYQGGASKIAAPGGVNGDPHFKTWAGELYDFHGICDLVLLQNAGFKNGLGMDIHVRSKQTRQWSYVSSAVLRIGEETFEVAGRGDGNKYWLNGVEHTPKRGITETIAGYQITYKSVNAQQKEYIVHLSEETQIVFKTWKDFVRVDMENANAADFAASSGLMGSFPEGLKVGRDNKTVFEDLNKFGQEWQVLANEPHLFHTVDGPQAPSHCEIPSTSAVRRKLAESSISLEDAEIACSRVAEADRDLCIFDVMATNDKEAAGAY